MLRNAPKVSCPPGCYVSGDWRLSRRVLNIPTRGLGDTSVRLLTDLAVRKECTLLEAIESMCLQFTGIERTRNEQKEGLEQDIDGSQLPAQVKKKVKKRNQPGKEDSAAAQVGDILRSAKQREGLVKLWLALKTLRREAESFTVSELIKHCVTVLAIDEYLLALPDGQGRWKNVQEMWSGAQRIRGRGGEALQRYLEEVVLDSANVDDSEEHDLKQANKVSLMTVHASKGLEFNTVFMVGMEEGTFPHHRAMMNAQELEEERRLAYVGVTRARDRLYMTTRARVARWNSEKLLQATKPSRFLECLPPHLTEDITFCGRPARTGAVERVVVALTRAQLSNPARALLQAKGVQVVSWSTLKDIASGRRIHREALTPLDRNSDFDARGDLQRAFSGNASSGLLSSLDKPSFASNNSSSFKLVAPYKPTGDQPTAISELLEGLSTGRRFQTLLGATGYCDDNFFGYVQQEREKMIPGMLFQGRGRLT